MEDREIVQLYWQRNSAAIEESNRKYGRSCRAIAYDILKDHEDSEECLNDTLLSAWNSIPPKWPEHLGAYLYRIIRNVSLDCLRHKQRLKRGGLEEPLVFEELEGCVAAKGSAEKSYEAKELFEAINRFLYTIPENDRAIFIIRYWLYLPTAQIAQRMKIKESTVNNSLHKSRKRLRIYLVKENLL